MLRCKRQRLASGLSQNEVARQARLHPSTVCTIESGRFLPGRGQLARLAAALNFSDDPERLLEEVQDAPS